MQRLRRRNESHGQPAGGFRPLVARWRAAVLVFLTVLPPGSGGNAWASAGEGPPHGVPNETNPASVPASRPASLPAVPYPVIPVTASSTLIPNGTELKRPVPGAEPRFVLSGREYDFGAVDPGATHTGEVGFQNEGPGDLYIYQIRPACACIIGGVYVDGALYTLGTPIAKGSRGSIRFSIRGTWGAGPKNTRVDILTNDVSLPPTGEAPFGHTNVKISAVIEKLFAYCDAAGQEFSNNRWIIGSSVSGQVVTREMILKNVRGESFSIVSIVPEDPLLKLTASPDVDGKSASWRIRAVLSDKAPYGSYARRFQIITKPEHGDLVFYVDGVVGGLLEIDPLPSDGARLGLFTASNRVQKSIHIKTNAAAGSAPAPIQITNIRFCELSDFKAEGGVYQLMPGKRERQLDPRVSRCLEARVREVRPGTEYAIDLLVKEGMLRGAMNAMLVFDTAVPGGPATVAIPVIGVSR